VWYSSIQKNSIAIKENPQESRKEWILEMLKKAAEAHQM